jgi:hypothetical protein
MLAAATTSDAVFPPAAVAISISALRGDARQLAI